MLSQRGIRAHRVSDGPERQPFRAGHDHRARRVSGEGAANPAGARSAGPQDRPEGPARTEVTSTDQAVSGSGSRCWPDAQGLSRAGLFRAGGDPEEPGAVLGPVAEEDPAAIEVVLAQLEQDAVERHDLDVVAPDLPTDVGEHPVPVGQFHAKSRVPKALHDGAFHFYSRLTHQRSTSSRLLPT